MQKSLIFSIVFCAFALAPKPSLAGPALERFEKNAFAYIEACEQACPAGTYEESIFENGRALTKAATPRVIEKLRGVAIEQAYIWGDTILGGDFHADGETQLQKIALIFKDGKPFAYRIWYFENAWDTSECEFDGINDSSLATCLPGIILESSLVALNLKYAITDYNNAANFYESQP